MNINKTYLCLTSIDGYKIRMRADSILEYGELYGEDQMTDGKNIVLGDKSIVGSYINSTNQDGDSTWVTETVDQIDEMLSSVGCQYEHAREEVRGWEAARSVMEQAT